MHVVIYIGLLKRAIRGLEICVADFEKFELYFVQYKSSSHYGIPCSIPVELTWLTYCYWNCFAPIPSFFPVDSSINGSNTFVTLRKTYDNQPLPAR